MVELAKSHITITDDSAYSTGIDTLIPLYVFATKENKVVDEITNEIAIGTTKELANQVSVVTSKKDVIDKFGIPFFAKTNGTVLQGDERNEYGLYGLFDAMGTTSVAYALRADIDLSQLEAKEAEPRSKVKNGTYWLDFVNTSFGLFECNGETTKAEQWTAISPFSYYDGDAIDSTSKVPLGTRGDVGDYAVTYQDGEFRFWEKTTSDAWTEIGTGHSVYHSSSIKYPDNPQAKDIWVKMTPVNNGSDYKLKRYSAASDFWMDSTLPIVSSLVDAEAAYGKLLEDGAKCLLADATKTSCKTYQYIKTETGTIVTGSATPTEVGASSMIIKFVNDGALKSIEVSVAANTPLSDVVALINSKIESANATGLSAEVKSGSIQLVASTVSVFNISDKTGETSMAQILGLPLGDHYPSSNSSWKLYTDMIVSVKEPTEDAEEGTLWYNDDIKVDIMVNYKGTEWRGFENYYSSQSEMPGIFVTSVEPETAADFSIWINPIDEDYPVIRRKIAGIWEIVDNTDQTTPSGVVFADARYYAENSGSDVDPTYSTNSVGKVSSNLLTSNKVDPDCPNPETYPDEILLFNTRFSTNNVKEFKKEPFEGLYQEDGTYTIGGKTFTLNTDNMKRWVSASGNAENGAGLFGRRAQRKMVTNALASAIKSNEDIRTTDYDFFFATCPGYPELDDELISLNVEKKEMFEIISDTPSRLAPNAAKIQNWATNKDNAISHGADGRVLRNAYVTRQYPPMGMASNVDGNEIAVPTSIVHMNNLLVLPRGQIAAGLQNGLVTNVASVGYITDEDEYASVLVKDGLGEVLVSNAINPIMTRRNSGLVQWGEWTENPYTSALSDEHVIITLLRLKRDLETVIQPYFFRINTEALRNDFHKALKGILDQYISTNEIYDYTIETGAGVNTADRINRKELWAYIAIEPSKGIEQIFLPIRVVSTGALSNS